MRTIPEFWTPAERDAYQTALDHIHKARQLISRTFRGSSREAAVAVTKMDEARLWLHDMLSPPYNGEQTPAADWANHANAANNAKNDR